MYAIGESIKAVFLFLHPRTGAVVAGATVTAAVYDEAGAQYSAPTVTEIGGGLYSASFSPDAAGEWIIKFSCADPVQYGGFCFSVGKGVAKDVEDKVDALNDLSLADVEGSAVLAKEATLTHATYGLDKIKTETASILSESQSHPTLAEIEATSVLAKEATLANATYGLSAIKTSVNAIPTTAMRGTDNAMLAANGALEATLTALKGVGWTDETLKAIKDAIDAFSAGAGTATIEKQNQGLDGTTDLSGGWTAGTDNIMAIRALLDDISDAVGALEGATAQQIWEYATRTLSDKANFTLASGEYDNIRKSVCLTGDTANSIGKILYDFYVTRLTATRCGYIDNLSGGAVALNSTVAKEATLTHATYGLDKIKTETAAIKAKTDNIGASVALETGGNVAAVKAKTDNLPASPANEATFTHATYGIDKIKTETAAIKAKTDLIPADPAETSDVTTAHSTTDGLITTIDGVVDAIKLSTDKLAGNATVTGTFASTNNTDEQTIKEVTLSAKTKIHAFLVDVNALTKSTTIRVYLKVDGANYRLSDTFDWTTSDADVINIQATTLDVDIKVTMQSVELEGASRNLPYRVITESM